MLCMIFPATPDSDLPSEYGMFIFDQRYDPEACRTGRHIAIPLDSLDEGQAGGGDPEGMPSENGGCRMSIAINLQRAREWRKSARTARDTGSSEHDRLVAHWNAASFERDYFAEILQTVAPDACRVATEMLYPGSANQMEEIFATIERNVRRNVIAR
jgi:hypothetical protein